MQAHPEAERFEIWSEDGVRVGQKGWTGYVCWQRGQTLRGLRDVGHQSARIISAICPAHALRAMELQAGQPARKGNKRGTAYAYNVKALRDAEIELTRHAEQAYERFVGQWQRRGAKQRTGAAK